MDNSSQDRKEKLKYELRIAKENGIQFQDVSDIHNSQYEYVAETIREGEFRSVMLPYLGKFLVKPGRLKKLNIKMAKELSRKKKNDRRKEKQD